MEMVTSKYNPKQMRNILMERIKLICAGKATGTTQDLCHLASAINKSIELECRIKEMKKKTDNKKEEL
jgi:hypothetical protein